MAKAMENTEIEEFLNGQLVSWFKSCLNTEELSYEALVDGVLIHNVFLQMDLETITPEAIKPSSGDSRLRQRNLRCILANLQAGLDACGSSPDTLDSPDVVALAREPELHIAEAERLLLLLLGCAVQCPKRAEFVERIRSRLDEPTQTVLSVYIARIVKHASVQELDHEVIEAPSAKRYSTPRKLGRPAVLKRNSMQHSTPHKDGLDESRLDEHELSISMMDCSVRSARSIDEEETRRRETELLEWKSRVRSQQVELKECAEDLDECREELAECKDQLVKLQRENDRLVLEARNAKSYRDELDVANEKAVRADRLEQDIARYKERLASVDFYKNRLDEVREDNRLLMENKEMMVEQARVQKVKFEKARLEFEKQIFELQEQLEELTQEKASDAEKYRELCEENSQLERLLKSSTSDALERGFIVDSDDSSSSLIAIDNSLSEQLTNAAQSQALKLELENRRLSTLVDSLTECSLHESSSRLQDLENDRQQLGQTIDSLRADIQTLSRRNEELEVTLKTALDDNEHLQQQLSRELSHKCDDLEKRQAAVTRDKMRLQTLLDSAQKRARELERSLCEANRELDERKAMKDTVNEMRIRQKELESEKKLALEEADRQRELAKEARLELEVSTRLARELERRLDKLERKSDDSKNEVAKLEEIYKSLMHRKTEDGGGKDTAKLQSLIETIEEQSQLKHMNSQLAAEKSILLKSREKLSSDQEQLKTLYEQLNSDYQNVLQERRSLSAQLRDAKLKLRRQHASIECLETSCKSLEGECQELRSIGAVSLEYNELKEDFGQLFKSNEALQAEHRRLKIELTDCQSELKMKITRVAELELEQCRLEQRCKILSKMNETLEMDKRSLMEHVSQLLQQNHKLISQTLEDREHYHMEERKNNDKVMNLRRQKEKLEEKIMEHYRRLDNCPASRKSKGIVNKTFKKMRRASSEFFNRSRRSWAESSSSDANASADFEYVPGNESDLSLDSSRMTPEPRYLELDEHLVGLRNPRRARVSDFGLGLPRSRMSIDALSDFFDEGLSKPRTRKTIDFLGIFENAVDEEEDLDRTLNDDTEQLAGKGDEEVFSIKKPVDLSSEEEGASPRFVNHVEYNNNDRNSSNNNLDESSDNRKSGQETWQEYGCA